MANFGGYSPDKTKLDGGTLPIIPSGQVISSFEYLEESGGNRSMDVNGSSTPRIFEAEVPVGQVWYVTAITWFFADNQIKQRNDFGDVGELSNGLLAEFEINSTDYQHSNTRNNMEVGQVFTATNDGGDDNNKLASDKPAYFGEARIHPSVCLQAGDKVKATVRDNLNGLDDMRMGIRYWRVL